ncbi:PD-(D/E)XK nuclease family transposase [Bacillus mycoides]|uniref:PD-(D/E)XK nuclease family transposase n=1 Tax=Bacillus mycoides TaxID=1405 RepID=UPI003D1F8168
MSNQSLVNLRIDFAFKQLFGTSGSEEILITFLNGICCKVRKSISSLMISIFTKLHIQCVTFFINCTI